MRSSPSLAFRSTNARPRNAGSGRTEPRHRPVEGERVSGAVAESRRAGSAHCYALLIGEAPVSGSLGMRAGQELVDKAICEPALVALGVPPPDEDEQAVDLG